MASTFAVLRCTEDVQLAGLGSSQRLRRHYLACGRTKHGTCLTCRECRSPRTKLHDRFQMVSACFVVNLRGRHRRSRRDTIAAAKASRRDWFEQRGGEDIVETRPGRSLEAKFCGTRGFDPVIWQSHVSPRRYIRDLGGLFIGSTTRRIAPILITLVAVSALAQGLTPILPDLKIPLTPFELTAPLIGLLLVFRTDKSYDRYKTASDAVFSFTCKQRSLILGFLSSTSNLCPRNVVEVENACSLIVDYHTWILTAYLLQDAAGNRLDDSETRGAQRAMATSRLNQRLGRPSGSFLTPGHVQLAVSQEINQTPHLNDEQHDTLNQLVASSDGIIGECERLLRSPISMNYTLATLRFLFLWLTLLPFGLVGSFEKSAESNWFEEVGVLVPLVTVFTALMFLTLEDVATQIEEPFNAQRKQLQNLSDWFALEAAEMMDIHKSFCIRKARGETTNDLPNSPT